jgi:photosystem II stability/assembly factor-like uncharacterized protein
MKIRISFLLVALLFSVSGFSQVKFNSNIFGDLTARQIGPAVMSGRITAIDGVNKEPNIIYVGSASGGLWKSLTGGTLFKPIFDKYCQSIGAIAIDQNKPDIIWVGTGESNMRNSVSVGTGLYKSEDAGETWKISGLENSEHISKISIDPMNGDIVYVAVPGALWSDSDDRGLYKTTDGGKSWEKILYVNEKTGCADVLIDPTNPETIYASMWQFRRTPHSFFSGGEGSGLYKSLDGGLSWKRIDKQFSEGELGRICIALCASEPNKIYAIAESKKTALFVSSDGGENWKKNSTTSNVTARPFYFSTIVVDPNDPKRVYRPAFSLSISDDGGESFAEASFEGGWVHSDHHALWINPKNSNQMYLGTDGGVYMSLNRGNDWMFLANLPVSQFYHVTTDNQKPYNVYGGLQDNGSWMGPSERGGGIHNKDWINVGGGDGFAVVADALDNNIIYSESQGGNISRLNRKTGETKAIQPQQGKDEPKLRFNWNTPIVQSPNNPGVIYTGSQFLYRTNNKGDTWEKISSDLTTNDISKQKQEESGGLSIENTSAENHCTIYTIEESPLNADVIWVGTDDGNVQITEDGGNNWKNVAGNITGLPKNTWCSSIDPGNFDINTAYATFDGHRSGDKNMYVYKTTNTGKTWKQLSTNGVKGYVHKIREDCLNKNLLFLGTEYGLYISIDGGQNWAQFTNKVPNVPVMDMVINKVTNSLVLATHGRGVIILDDLTPIRNINQQILDSDFEFLPARNYFIDGSENLSFSAFPSNAGEFNGPNPSGDFHIIYYLKERMSTGELKIEIYNKENKLLNTIEASKRKGINIEYWNMRLKPPKVATGSRFEVSGFIGPLVPEGEYKIKLIKGENSKTLTVNLTYNPNSPYTSGEREEQQSTVMKLFNMQEDLALIAERLKNRFDSIKINIKNVTDDTEKEKLTKYSERLDSLSKTLAATKEGGFITGEVKLRENIGQLYTSVISFNGKPSDSQLERLVKLEYELEQVKKRADELLRIKNP